MKNPPSERPDSSGSGQPQSSEAIDSNRDVVLVHGVTEDRQGLKVLRARGSAVEVGEVRPLREGQHITADVVRLHPRKSNPFVCDVETTFSAGGAESGARGEKPRDEGVVRRTAGPAQVATRAYRDNWDQIWARQVSAPGSSDLN